MRALKSFRKWIRKYPLAHKFIKFVIVGCAAAGVSLFVFWVTTLQFPQYNLLAKAIGYVLGFFVGFTLNKFWTYVEHTDEGEKYLLKYVLVYVITFFVYLAFNYTCDHIFRLHQPVYWVLDFLQLHTITEYAYTYDTTVSNIVAIVLNAVLNFLGTNYMVFRVPNPEELFD
ncbi:MAG: GtrA family protein [Bacteroidia bacterium]|jgi:putative flippase GtrA